MHPETDLAVIARHSATNESANELLKERLLRIDSEVLDNTVYSLYEALSPQIDCTACGNCCRSLLINVEKEDARVLAGYLDISIDQFRKTYVEESSSGELSVMNKIPCHFLKDNMCTVYAARPAECREFPGLHRPGFNQRLFATFMHYGRCPIIYNVIEGLRLVY